MQNGNAGDVARNRAYPAYPHGIVDRRAAALLGLLAVVASCAQPTEVATSDLSAAVARDGIVFDGEGIPNGVLDRLASHRVVIVGETHFLLEHDAFMGELVEALYARDFRQLLVEWPQMADWILEDYVAGGQLEPEWEPPAPLGLAMFAAIREFNSTLPSADRIQVRAIDVNLDDYGGARDFRGMLRRLSSHLPAQGPIAEFLQAGYATPSAQISALESLGAALRSDRTPLINSWGEHWHSTVAEMVEVELASVSIRSMRKDHYTLTARLRENVMKRMADLRIGGFAHGTLINVGGHHAQKEHLLGTDQEWLGDYLVHESAAVGGSAIVLDVGPARIVSSSPGEATLFDIRDASPENELWRVMSETWPEVRVFLPLDDPVFLAGGVSLNYEGFIYAAAPKRHYDALLLLPLAHRVAQ